MPVPLRLHRLARRLCIVAVILAWGLFSPTSLPAEVTKEYQVKAAFIYNFTRFVEWAPERFASASSPLVIAVLGANPFGDELARIVSDRQANGHEIVIQQISSIAENITAHIVFISDWNGQPLPAALARLRQRGVLTIGESPAFGAAGGMINFVLEGDKVRFEINRRESEQAGLKISAQLLKLATPAPKKS